MKRPDLELLFGPVGATPVDLAKAWQRHLVDDLGGHLGQYYARAPRDPGSGIHEHIDETMDLVDFADLLRRGSRDGDFAWQVRVPFGFANADVLISVFRDEQVEGTSTAMIIEPSITRFLESEETTRKPFAALLLQAATAVGSPRLLAGLRLPWVALTDAVLAAGGSPQSEPYLAAWRTGDPNPDVSWLAWPRAPAEFISSTLGYAVVARWPG